MYVQVDITSRCPSMAFHVRYFLNRYIPTQSFLINLRPAGIFRRTRPAIEEAGFVPLPNSRTSGRSEANEKVVENSQRVPKKKRFDNFR